jgi:hypothetical protein
MKQQFVVTHRYKILPETKILPTHYRSTLKHIMFVRKYKDKFFVDKNILTEGVFVNRPVMRGIT